MLSRSATKLKFKSFCINTNHPHYLTSISLLNYSQTQTNHIKDNSTIDKPKNIWEQLMLTHGPDKLYASSDYNRWKVVPFAVSTNLCLGACYAWSIFNEPLTRELGVIASSSQDWTLPSVMSTFTGIILFQGISMAILGKWSEKVGPRITGVVGASLYGGGMLVGALGVYTHTLPLLYFGYGAMGGCGMGLSYLPPISVLLSWFPDRKGLATGMAISGFGGGGAIIVTLKKILINYNFIAPSYIGTNDNIFTKRENGKLLAEINDNWSEVVNINANDLSNITLDGLQEGMYLVGSGNTGVALTMGTLGLGYLVTMLTCASKYKLPKTSETNGKLESENVAVQKYVSVDDVMKTPQFWLVFTTLLSTGTVGMGLMSCAKDVLNTCFIQYNLNNVCIAAFAATYVQLLSVGNVSGRFIWASLSDKIGRKNTFTIFTCVGGPLYLSLPWIISYSVSNTTSFTPIIMFYTSTMLIISFFGAGYSTMPAYEGDLFGVKNVASIHGRVMIATSIAAIAGPTIFSKLREKQEINAILELTNKCDQQAFMDKFGVGINDIQSLIDANAIKISSLLEICSDNVIDPTPYLYNPAFKTMGCVLGIGALANFAIKPVEEKWFKKQ
eukprot:313988_1